MSNPISESQCNAVIALVLQKCDQAAAAVTQNVDAPWNNDRAIALNALDKVRTQSVPALRSLWARHGDDDPDRWTKYAAEVLATPAAYVKFDVEGDLNTVITQTAQATAVQTAAVAKEAISEAGSLAASTLNAVLPTWAKVGLAVVAVGAVVVLVAMARGQIAAARSVVPV